MNQNLISPADAPVAAQHQISIQNMARNPEFCSITTLILLDTRINGELMIERFARDQVGREFLIAIHPDNCAEVFVHKRHLVDRHAQRLEFNRSHALKMIVPTYLNGKPHETSRRTLETPAKA